MENQVRYNSRRSGNNPQCLEWFFLIINRDKREISRITLSTYELFAPIVEEYKNDKGNFKHGLMYQLLNFDSEKRLDSDWRTKIFRRVIKDRDLYRRTNDDDALEKYISSLDKD
jgi:hypothetical protein